MKRAAAFADRPSVRFCRHERTVPLWLFLLDLVTVFLLTPYIARGILNIVKTDGEIYVNNIIICNSCGAKCSSADPYCKKCSEPLNSTREFNRSAIEGIDNEQLKAFVGKNADYYTEKFTKSGGKRWFLQINWPALLLGHIWMFYRKMRKFAVLYAVIVFGLSAIFSVGIPLLFRKDVDTYFECKAAYDEFLDSGEETSFFYKDENGVTLMESNPVYKELRNNLATAQTKIRWLNWAVEFPPLLVSLILRLSANSMYKQHIIGNIDTSEGGTSKKQAFWGWLVVWVMLLVAGLLLLSIDAVSRLNEAYDLLLPKPYL